ncbi:MAG TPA: hypothetical protein VKR57_06620 [Terriglobales bacterium]|nr:hypothetical protein [Terriglobales bacterium]
MAFCISCGAQMPAGATACPACGRATAGAAAPAPSSPSAVGGLTDNVAGALAYVTIIPAIVFLIMEPYNRNRFIRFHSFQCIFAAVAWTALWIALGIVVRIPFFGWLTFLVWPLVSLAGFVVWLVLVLKAYQGQRFKLPVIGDIAETQADA